MLKEQLRVMNQEVSGIDLKILAHLRSPSMLGREEVSALRERRVLLCQEAEEIERTHPGLRDEIVEEDLHQIALSVRR
jgi:hypothetical protein